MFEMFKNNSVIFQYLATISVNLLTISYGTSAGWTSKNILLLQSAIDTPLADVGPLTIEQLSWISSLLGLGGICGTLIFGWLSNRYGRKLNLLIVAIPQIFGWLLIIFAENAIMLYVSRFSCGLTSGGLFVLIPIFIAEIAEDKCRGALGSILTVSANIGILLAFLTGHFFTFYTEAYLLICLPIIFIVIILYIPETPIFLMKSNRYGEAERSMRFYRNIQGFESKEKDEIHNEMKNLRQYLKKDQHVINNNGIIVDDQTTTTRFTLSLNDFKTKSVKKSILIAVAMIAFHELCGAFILINYTATIFYQSESNISPLLSAIIVGVIQLIGTYISTLLVDKYGRKCLLICSTIGAAIGLFALGTFMYLNYLHYELNAFKLVPVVSFSFFIFLASCGILPIPWIIVGEILPEKIRNFGTTICACFSWTLSFVLLKCFAPLSESIGMHNCVYLFCLFSIIACIFVIIWLPETKGKSYNEIQQELER